MTSCELSGNVDSNFDTIIVSTKCESVKSFRVHANDATLNVVRAIDAVILINTSAYRVVVESNAHRKLNGNADVIIRDSFIHTDIVGANCVSLNDTTVLGSIKCTGSVNAKGCNLANVEATNSITLASTIAAVLTINVEGTRAYLNTMNGCLFDRVIVKQLSQSMVELHTTEPITCPVEFQGCKGIVICNNKK